MVTVIIKRTDEPKVIQLTQENIMRDLSSIVGSEMLLEDTWHAGLQKVRTPFVCLVEADCVLSAGYLASNIGILKKASVLPKGGGNTRLALLASCLGVKKFDQRIYNYELGKVDDRFDTIALRTWQLRPNQRKGHTKPYPVQVAFIPGAVIRYASIKDIIDSFAWDQRNVVNMSMELSFHLWNTNRRLEVNPNTTYVSNLNYLEKPPKTDIRVPDFVANLFAREGL